MSEKQVGTAVLNFGTVDETWGIAENVDVAPESDKKQIKNGKGDTVGLIYTDGRRKVTAEFTPLAGQTAPAVTEVSIIGEQLTVKTISNQTITIIVDGASTKYKKGDVSTFSINGYDYPNVTITESE